MDCGNGGGEGGGSEYLDQSYILSEIRLFGSLFSCSFGQ